MPASFGGIHSLLVLCIFGAAAVTAVVQVSFDRQPLIYTLAATEPPPSELADVSEIRQRRIVLMSLRRS